jgi:hypothetical protein
MTTARFHDKTTKTFASALDAQTWANNNGFVWFDSINTLIEDVEDGVVAIEDTMLIEA